MPESASLVVEHVAWLDPRAVALRQTMDAEMQVRYGDNGPNPDLEHAAAVAKALAVDESTVVDTILLNVDGEAVAHAAIRRLGEEWEVKRVIVRESHRQLGLGRTLLTELTGVARAHGARRIILQAGDRQPEAVRLYTGLGYMPIPVYEPYAGPMPQSLCFELVLDESVRDGAIDG